MQRPQSFVELILDALVYMGCMSPVSGAVFQIRCSAPYLEARAVGSTYCRRG